MQIHMYEVMLRAQKGYAKALEPICKKWELTRNELDILLFLFNNPELDRPTDIVKVRAMSKSHVSLSVGNLTQRGLLRRWEDPEDRRVVHLELIGDAREIGREAKTVQWNFFDKIYGSLSKEEFQQWGEITRKICKNIDELDID